MIDPTENRNEASELNQEALASVPSQEEHSLTSEEISIHDEHASEEDEHDLDIMGEQDFSQYTKEQFVEASAKLFDENNFKKVDELLRLMKVEVDRINKEEREEALQKFLAEGGEQDAFEFKSDALIDKFYANYKALKDRKAKYYNELEKRRQKNYDDKNAILQQIKALVEGGDTGKGSLDKLKELQQKWKEVGPVPPQQADALYSTYDALLDRFYSQKSIEIELIELDRRKNLAAKQEICERAEALAAGDNINAAISALNKLKEEYKSVGPVPKDQQEAIWQRFKAAADAIYERKRKASEEMRRILEENMKAKQALCVKIEPFAEFNSDRITEWNAKTKEIMALQAEWEKIGPAPKEVAKDINKQFWSNFKQFFAAKGRFFDQLEKTRQENLSQKIELCLQAEALKDSNEWDAVTATLKKLQDQWKKIGSVPESQREAIYQRFKAACDYFFERKRNKSQAQEKEFDTNLAKKRAICEQIEALAAAKETDLAKLEELHKSFLAIGFVPRNQVEKIADRLDNAITSFLKNLDMPEEEREKIKFQLQLQSLEGNPDAGRIIAKQEQALRKKIAAMENDISLWKNNLDFFANSKTADKLRRDFQVKIDAAENQLDKLRSQLRALVNTVNKK
ncbi:DUF349 domain-containing protein [Rhodoflexus caldus]|uniref:DUF349 domain-containing protein n=1 Tax=Rhodoflexus caldus TaxID=2891236 RepID=UPI00202A1790|nr:DUF349 domain-containing protein [Rhodoflexus caldus]